MSMDFDSAMTFELQECRAWLEKQRAKEIVQRGEAAIKTKGFN